MGERFFWYLLVLFVVLAHITYTDGVGRCSKGYFKCQRGGMCFDLKYKCDGFIHCHDGSDEYYCKGNEGPGLPKIPDVCPKGYLKCDHGGCFELKYKCDGYNHCGDNSDEFHCAPSDCPRTYFNCGNGLCIPLKYQCDGNSHCANSEDEHGCNYPDGEGDEDAKALKKCPATQFQCKSGGCLDVELVCDGYNQCGDSSDEEKCGEKRCPLGFLNCESEGCFDANLKCDGTKNCADGSDESSCPQKRQVCPPQFIKCATGTMCIPPRFQCDGVKHCKDGSDELACNVGCADKSFRCSNGTCIEWWLRCDETDDCGDNSDEETCLTNCPSDTFFTCDNKACVHTRYTCDGKQQCEDGSDESRCLDNCPEGFTKCAKSIGCIDNKFVCDGKTQCYDESDEQDCGKCGPDQIVCDITRCVHKTRKCNGMLDCWDGTDEMSCSVEGCQKDEFRCLHGGCIPLFFRCDGIKHCGDLSDEHHCPRSGNLTVVEEDMLPCVQNHKDYFLCKSGDRCLPNKLKCDGSEQCEDGSDEIHCKVLCEGSFMCWIGGCIKWELKCDGFVHCSDGSDEKNCGEPTLKCHEGYFKCKSGSCLPMQYRCDRYVQCTDGSDEQGCKILDGDFSRRKRSAEIGCPQNFYQCDSGECLLPEFVCDGIFQCSDGTDEEQCNDFYEPRYQTDAALNYQTIDPNQQVITPQLQNLHQYNLLPTELLKRSKIAIMPKSVSRKKVKGILKEIVQSPPGLPPHSGVQTTKKEFEIVVPCDDQEFRCTNGMCIDNKNVCDGKNQCDDGLDEFNCTKNSTDVKSEGMLSTISQAASKFRGAVADFTNRYIWGALKYPFSFMQRSLPLPSSAYAENFVPCTNESFNCTDGKCINPMQQCDGRKQCSDGSDELHCSKKARKDTLHGAYDKGDECEENQFKCTNGLCIRTEFRCDGHKLCPDGSDELNCTEINECGLGYTKCKDGGCIPLKYLCDGLQHCNDGSDEDNCFIYHVGEPIPKVVPMAEGAAKCAMGNFQCGNGKCLKLEAVCDGTKQCTDALDEKFCFGKMKSVIPVFQQDDSQETEIEQTCVKGNFQCKNEKCIDIKLLCNGFRNCEDGLDEENCYFGCRVGNYLCQENHECINVKYLCNNFHNCVDGSDENHCYKLSFTGEIVDKERKAGCKVGHFQCIDGSCIEAKLVCNEEADCNDATDEQNCFHYMDNSRKSNDSPIEAKQETPHHISNENLTLSTGSDTETREKPPPVKTSRTALATAPVKSETAAQRKKTSRKKNPAALH